jgi:hypothetical protein
VEEVEGATVERGQVAKAMATTDLLGDQGRSK